jgi:tripartite-type tricarboxylate transporter receptor subunit TctC
MSFAQDKPLRIVVPFPPGGATDIAGRSLQEPLQRLLGQPVVIENRAGAGGSIGMAEIARSAGDGLTFGVATLSTHGVNPAVYAKLPYDPVKDFAGVTEIVKAPGIIVVNPQVLPVKDFADLVKYLKANPGKISYATPGNGTIGHMWGELFKSVTGTAMVHIPYRGAGPAVNDVLGGQVPVYFDQVASSLPHVKAGKLKALAVSWPERLDVLPEIPTYGELGYPQANEPSWFGLVAPASTPASQVLRVQQAVATALKEPAVRDRLAGQGLYASGTTPADFSRQIVREIDKMKKVAAYAKIKIE